MKMLIGQEEFDKKRGKDLIPFECLHCGKTFYKTKRYVKQQIYNSKNPKQNRKNILETCSVSCSNAMRSKVQEVLCKQCGKTLFKKNNDIKKSRNHFCSRSCGAIYNNAHKNHGARRSKLEVWLEGRLRETYPELNFHFNRKDAINSELDIYIPELKLAFELNGIFHYEPIYGEEKLSKIQNNDNRKFQACAKKDISLCIIDTSQQKYFKPKTSEKYLTIICDIIKNHGALAGNRTLFTGVQNQTSSR